jgi:hypothetical protein
MDYNDKIKANELDSMGFDKFMSRPLESQPSPAKYIGGANFDILLDELLFNRMIRLKDLRVTPQGNDPGKIYWDGENKKFKLWIDAIGQWADIQYTSTSTSTTSSSTSSTSTSTTSTSSSSTSTSTTSSSSSTSTT